MKKVKRKKIINHATFWAIIAVSVLFSIFRFAPVFFRMLQAIVDFAYSFARYFLFFDAKESLLPATVAQIPEGMDMLLPYTFEEYKILWDEFWELFTNEANFVIWLYVCRYHLARFAKVVIILLFPLLSLAIVGYLLAKKVNRNGKDTKPTRVWKAIRRVVYLRLRTFLKDFFVFLKGKKLYRWIVWLLWLYNLNVLTIGVEAVAFVFHFAITFDFSNIFVQIAKLAVDLSVPLQFFPWWLTVILVLYVFQKIRCAVARSRVKKFIKKDEEFLERYPGALFIVGKQRSKKTSLLSMLKRVLERVFRKRAEEKILYRDKQFPNFSWADIDSVVFACKENGKFIVFEDVEKFAYRLERTCRERNIEGAQTDKHISIIKEEYGYDVNKLFEYIDDGYPVNYNNGIVNESLFKAIERYGQLLMIYGQKSSLDISNYSIREDFTFKDYGCFPIFDGDLIERTTEESEKNTQFSHIVRYDAFRLGEAFEEDSREEIAIEYGIGVEAEFSKERKNKVSRAGLKAGDTNANQNNDLFELDTKMRGHIATIDNYDFWRWLFDDQREDGLGADNRDMTTTGRIKKTEPLKVLLPFFVYDEMLYDAVFGLRDKIKLFYKNRKKGKHFIDYLLDLICGPLFRHYDRMRNRYGMYRLRLKMEDGKDKEVLQDSEYAYILTCVAYNDVFATDSHRTFFKKKHRKATINLDSSRQYSGLYPTMDEYRYQQSYLVEDMNYAFGDARERKKKKKDKEKQEDSKTGV